MSCPDSVRLAAWKGVVLALTALLIPIVLGSAECARAQPPAPPGHRHDVQPPDYAQSPPPGIPLAPRLQNLGVHTFPVSTSSEQAQRFINQGLNLAYGFNHAEAGRAFAEAARLDPSCAMAFWGQALVLGPNINAAMEADSEPRARELVERAVGLKAGATPREQGYIDALVARYTGNAADRKQADRAYARAMGEFASRFPEDLDAKTLYAESLMDLRPWNYWTRDDQPYDETGDVRTALEEVLARSPSHPGALHYWIHLWEPTRTPERAEAEADRLLPLMPAAGHIVHMPAHIYMRVGRHGDVVRANQLAAKADEDYIAQCRAQGMYPLGYYPHNLHFIWMGATASGQRQVALDASRKVAAAIPDAALAQVPTLQGFLAVPWWAMVQFGEWDGILAAAPPRHDTPFMRGVWRYARGMALVASGRARAAAKELAQLDAVLGDPSLAVEATFSTNSGRAILRIAREVVAGNIAADRGDWDQALLHLDRAVRYEDGLIYQEPSDWHAPVRQTLGAVLLQAGRADEAEAVYWDDLRRNPGNGWSLFGLTRALEAQGKKEEAALAERRFREAWKEADITLTASRVGWPASRDRR